MLPLGKVKAWPWGRIVVIALLCVAVVVGLIWGKKLLWPVKPIDTTPQVAREAPQAEDIPKLEIPPPKKLVVYSRDELLRKVPVPAPVAQNHNNQFTATAAITPSPHGGTAVSFTNTSTGQSAISYSAKPRPVFGFGGEGAVGIRAGVGAAGNGTGYTGNIYVRQKIVRVADVQVSGVGELNVSTYDQPEARGLVEVELFNWR